MKIHYKELHITFLICTFCICSLFAVARSPKNLVTIEGKSSNPSDQLYFGSISSGLPELLPAHADMAVIPDINGSFKISMNLSAPAYFYLGNNILYLSPGDSINAEINYKYPSLSVFSGKGSETCNYLRGTLSVKMGSFLGAVFNQAIPYISHKTNEKPMFLDPKRSLDSVMIMSEARKKQLINLTNISDEFRRLEQVRIDADLMNSCTRYSVYYKVYTQYFHIPSDSTAITKYDQISTPVYQSAASRIPLDTQFLKIQVYSDILPDILKAKPDGKKKQLLQQFEDAKELAAKIKKAGDKNSIASYKSQVQALSNDQYRADVMETYQQRIAFGEGDPAKDIIAVDSNGHTIQLSSLKGKVIYVDMWATWCGPCMQEMPHYEDLKKQFKDDPNVAFVSLSLDKDLAAWKKSLQSRNADGYQWNADNTLVSKDYSLIGIPRTILITKDFKIAEMAAPMPSDPRLVKKIKELESKD